MNWLPAMLIAVVAVLGPGAAGPAAGPLIPAVHVQSEDGDLSLTVERDSGRAVPGQDTAYTITVANPADRERRVTVRASLPPWISGVRIDPDGQVGDGYVDWVVTVAPEDFATLRLRGSYRDPAAEGGAPGATRVAVTACVVAGEPRHPVVCDTDIADLARGSPVVMVSLVATGAAVGLVMALLARTAARRRRAAPASAA